MLAPSSSLENQVLEMDPAPQLTASPLHQYRSLGPGKYQGRGGCRLPVLGCGAVGLGFQPFSRSSVWGPLCT